MFFDAGFFCFSCVCAYVVNATSKLVTSESTSLINRLLSLLSLVCSFTTRICGAKRLNSFIQLVNTDSGTITKCGPGTLACLVSHVIRVMVCTVLPRPISSPKMQFTPRLYMLISQFSPASW